MRQQVSDGRDVDGNEDKMPLHWFRKKSLQVSQTKTGIGQGELGAYFLGQRLF